MTHLWSLILESCGADVQNLHCKKASPFRLIYKKLETLKKQQASEKTQINTVCSISIKYGKVPMARSVWHKTYDIVMARCQLFATRNMILLLKGKVAFWNYICFIEREIWIAVFAGCMSDFKTVILDLIQAVWELWKTFESNFKQFNLKPFWHNLLLAVVLQQLIRCCVCVLSFACITTITVFLINLVFNIWNSVMRREAGVGKLDPEIRIESGS